MLKNKKGLNVLIFIQSNILGINKIMLFPVKMQEHVFAYILGFNN
jgi:hypothetical protein